jgi:hypothetical protein
VLTIWSTLKVFYASLFVKTVLIFIKVRKLKKIINFYVVQTQTQKNTRAAATTNGAAPTKGIGAKFMYLFNNPFFYASGNIIISPNY